VRVLLDEIGTVALVAPVVSLVPQPLRIN